eukprot:gene12480-biopygen1363
MPIPFRSAAAARRAAAALLSASLGHGVLGEAAGAVEQQQPERKRARKLWAAGEAVDGRRRLCNPQGGGGAAGACPPAPNRTGRQEFEKYFAAGRCAGIGMLWRDIGASPKRR